MGKGANATVFLSYNYLLNRYEALKIWTPRKNQKHVDIKRFLNEIQKNAVFHNDNIAQIYSASIVSNYYYILMEYCAGVTLKEYLRKTPNYCKRMNLLNTIASTMYEVYKNGLYHGDLHSKNIIVHKEKIKIIDFGTSVFTRDKSISHKRDAYMLFDLAIEILPELKDFTFFNNSVREKASIEICESILYLIHLLCSEIDRGDDTPYDYFVSTLASISKICSALSVDDVASYVSTDHFFRAYQHCRIDDADINKTISLNSACLHGFLADELKLSAYRERIRYI